VALLTKCSLGTATGPHASRCLRSCRRRGRLLTPANEDPTPSAIRSWLASQRQSGRRSESHDTIVILVPFS
jgi:hypothetical protein